MVHIYKEKDAQKNNMGETNEVQYNNLDELLISLVKERPALYDNRVLAKDRTKLMKQALWFEISKCMQGQLKPDAAQIRWKYLRENYLKARKKEKLKEDITNLTGLKLKTYDTHRRYSFRYYKIMEFLNESLDFQKIGSWDNTVISKDNTNQEVATKINAKVPSKVKINPLVEANVGMHNIDVQTITTDSFEEVNIDAKEDSLSSSSTQSFENSSNVKSNHKIRSYDEIFLECLQKPIEKPSPIDGFLIRLGEGLKRLPYRERSKLELEFLTRLHEVEEQLQLYEENS